jgi:hypothetical protein
MKVIGIAGYARCGKDTFVQIAKDILQKNNYRAIRMAFADMLKDEVTEMLTDHEFKGRVKTDDPVIKTQMRPLMVWWGCQRRFESGGGMYWVNEVDSQLRKIGTDMTSNGDSGENIVALISDVRFPNEAKWVHAAWGGQVIHLKKWQSEWRKGGQDGSDEVLVKVYDSAPNEEEAKQDPLVEAMADIKTEWEGKGKPSATDASTEVDLQKVVLAALNETKFFKHPEPVIGTLSL